MVRTLALICALWATQAQATCRQALLLALDVSGSVDAQEYLLQMGGVALALEDPQVQAALFALPEAPVSLAIFEWSASSYQRRIIDWTRLDTPADLAAVTATLRAWRRAPAPEATGIGAALREAAGYFDRAPTCWRRTLDISGDGKNNDWPIPRDVLGQGILAGVTINALVIGQEHRRNNDTRAADIAELTSYFRYNILQGPDAFLEVALGFSAYAAAMSRKLLRELSVSAVGSLPPARRHGAFHAAPPTHGLIAARQ